MIPKNDMIQIMFEVHIPENLSESYVKEHIQRQGYTRIIKGKDGTLFVVQDRVRVLSENSSRLTEAIEVALAKGGQKIYVQRLNQKRKGFGIKRGYTSLLICMTCRVEYSDPIPNLFSFNSPIGACENCRGFGQTLGIDYGLVIPDESLSIAQGAIKLFQSPGYYENYLDMMKFANKRGFPVNTPWKDLSREDKDWVIFGELEHFNRWYGVEGVFNWLETRKHRMHVRVLLSRYRAYLECPKCGGSRLKSSAMIWRLGDDAELKFGLQNHRHPSFTMSQQQIEALPGSQYP